MSEPQPNLQFERAEVPTTGVSCHACKQSIAAQYFQINGSPTCNACRDSVVKLLDVGFNPTDFAKALGLGSLAAVGGAALWYAVAYFTGYELGLIAIVVGVMVGKAIQWVIHGRGGLPFQILAITLTYGAIAIANVPFLLGDASLGTIGVIIAALLTPIYGGIMGWVILGIALYEAWVFTKRPDIQVTGPYQIGAPQPQVQ
jgi:hypothetical protein